MRRVACVSSHLVAAPIAASGDAKRPLAGVKVVDMTTVIAGPSAAAALAEFGADVTKVEMADGAGDSYRTMGTHIVLPSGEKYSATFAAYNAGKRGVAVNAQDPRGVEFVKRMVASADVFMQNMRPGIAERLGLGYDALKALNPKLIYVSISGFGPTGPISKEKVYDPLVQARAACAHVQGRLGTGGGLINMAMYDKTTGMSVVQAAIAALYARDVNGAGGQHVEMSMLDVGMRFMWGDSLATLGNSYFTDNDNDERIKSNAKLPAELFSMHDCKDGQVIFVAVSDKAWYECFINEFAPHLRGDKRYLRGGDRFFKNRAAFLEEVDKALADQPRDKVVAAFNAADVPVAPVLDIEESIAQPQNEHMGVFEVRDHPALGTAVRDVRLPARMSGTPTPVHPLHAPLYGEHSEAVARELGYSDQELEQLVKDGVLRRGVQRG